MAATNKRPDERLWSSFAGFVTGSVLDMRFPLRDGAVIRAR